MFMFTGGALSKLRHMQNGGKRARHSIDQWDKVSALLLSIKSVPVADGLTAKYEWRRVYSTLVVADEGLVMDRDRRLTGFLRGQTNEVDAPPGFELSSAWRVGDYFDGCGYRAIALTYL